MNTFEAALAQAVRNKVEADLPNRAVPEAQIMELKERFAFFQKTLSAETFPFKPGDIVTPRGGTGLVNTGEPHIVLEINPGAALNFDIVESNGDPDWGLRPNIRVMAMARDNESYLSWWLEAHKLEPYEG